MSIGKKQPREKVLPVAQHIIEILRPLSDRIELAGSLRRERPSVGDIEIVTIPKRPLDLLGQPIPKRPDLVTEFLNHHVTTFVKNGPKYKQFKYGRYTVDLFLPTAETWGAIYTTRTGSREFNLWLMNTVCPARGVRFDGGRLYGPGGFALNTPEERDVFTALNLPWIPPQYRDDTDWMAIVRRETMGLPELCPEHEEPLPCSACAMLLIMAK